MASLTSLFDEVNSAYEVKKTIQAYKQDPTLVAHDQNGDTRDFSAYAPIFGLPQDGGVGQPRGIRLPKAHVGWDFDIHNNPRGGKFDSTAILKS